MLDDDTLLRPRVRDRAAPAAADAIAFTGGAGIAIGVLLITSDFFAHGHGRPPGVALFAVLLAAGYLGLAFLPREVHAAAVTVIVAAVPGAIGWWILPHAHRFADVRPFLILVIVAWAACWFAPHTRGRTIFVAAALIVLWLWMLGEVAGTDAFSAAPIPSPPAHTTFSLSALKHEHPLESARATRRAAVTITDLDQTNPLWPVARECEFGDAAACDTLYSEAEPGTDYQQFADTCANRRPPGSGGECETLESSGFSSPTPLGPGIVPGTGVLGASTKDKSLEIGLVSLLFGIVYIGALVYSDRRRWPALGTAFVLPGLLALFTGTEALGNAAHHAWVGGLLTFVAGVAFAMVGDLGGRRFTTWGGGAFAALGVYTFAADVADFKGSFGGTHVKLVRPALITIAVGAALVALAWWLASMRSRYAGPAASPPSAPPSRPSPTPEYQPAPAAYPTTAPSPPEPPPAHTWQPPPPTEY